MAHTPESDFETFTSFANPNYRLNDDIINSNNTGTEGHSSSVGEFESFEDPYESIDVTSASSRQAEANKGRKKYAQLDLMAMGMNLNANPAHGQSPMSDSVTSPSSMTTSTASMDSPDGKSGAGLYESVDFGSEEKKLVSIGHTEEGEEEETPYATTSTSSKGFLGYYSSLENSAKSSLEEKKETEIKAENSGATKDKKKDINSPDSGISADHHDTESETSPGDVKHKVGPLTEDIYAIPERRSKTEEVLLPPGWEKHEDKEGPYYWHIKSGTIQREPPPPPSPGTVQRAQRQESQPSETVNEAPHVPQRSSLEVETLVGSVMTAADTSKDDSAICEEEVLHEFDPLAGTQPEGQLQFQEGALESPTSETGEKPIRFAVRSLGWVKIAEEDLTQEKSSRAVNKCIVDLSLGKNDINDVVGRWGDGKDLFMDLDSISLRLVDPQDFTVLNSQSIHSIRVWGVGRDNGRDFAYVARDPVTRKHMCHVFRCDTPARQIANTLRDICQKILAEKKEDAQAAANGTALQKMSVARPDNLPNLKKTSDTNGQKITFESLYQNAAFPTPMEEPKKVIKCHYLGSAVVHKPTGVDVLNAAIDRIYAKVPPEKWVFVDVGVAPSTITISEHKKAENILVESRVRFLSFMGIAMKNVKLCGYIMHNANDHYIAHAFHCEPSAGALCKTIEAACKLRFTKLLDSHPAPAELRYQKCLDAHPQTPDHKKQQQSKGIGATLKSVFGTLVPKKKNSKS
ncbi:protein Fe65 homolog isoform X2 [Lingula anatina]|uniref:Protein Fe65 homolog isoform X2 n=1 Tax=Lingula anatina TaxID=7574 RepID=A0A1S3JLK0_LINAN|nr:protein Fe65 homolog isoform X2 [Lingula anatina]XP_013411258.1 protein Fe65 homolog isoform X2 [Lingula anatina]XP_013411259.1 protein Fe65 homolog isoform X2 [Lingula anatina]XP_013411260.1 protein Fe65 homolog isoform X2 [Lingula anatina]|eukprot:XP_013411257.1 protein Fe65 homolog isoform X2 [Lingula anatina]